MTETKHVKDFPAKQSIVSITTKDTIPEALTKIFNNNILSAPVLEEDGQVSGSISVVDILLFCLNVCQTGQEIVRAFGLPIEQESKMVKFDGITNYLRTDPALAAAFSSDKAKIITNYSKREALPIVHLDSTVKALIGILASSHRAAVIDHKKLVNYITQSDAVEFIHQHRLVGPIGTKTVEALQIASKNVVTINQDQPVVNAFSKMIIHKVSGVGVVNGAGELVGCISAHDIRAVTGSGELLEHLYHSYNEYRQIMDSLKVPTKPQIIKANAQTNLNQVIDTLVKEKVHRLFVTDQHNHAIGVVSLGDVLRCISEH